MHITSQYWLTRHSILTCCEILKCRELCDTNLYNKMPSEDYALYVKEMRDWLNSQAHLPKDVSDNILYRFAHSCYFNMEKAKKAAELFFTIRGNSPEILADRDPFSPHMAKFIKTVNLACITISGNRRVWIWQLNDPGLENYDYLTDAKLFFLTTDSWLLDEETQFYENDIVVMDVKDIGIKMLTKLNMSIAKKLSKYQQEAMPIRLKHIHFVNSSSIMDKLFTVFKSLLNKEIIDLIHFHQPNSDSLFKFFNKDELPEDYGGTLPAMKVLMADAMKRLEKNRELLNNENLWVAQTKKNKKSAPAPVVEIDSFRSLAID
ncbi:alpha-tocopherol transfer protein-like [Aricia agestis]|uniref:alpha-tocopherol transfer protein-like n=1 Tax=Aricia agestis TaxID=91739 RepID=UPI001C206E97|nr:alpha-tocopherol transfer protein-like [Aricia agestis]